MPTLSPRAIWLLAAASGSWVAVLVGVAWPERWWLGMAAAVWFGGSVRAAAYRPWPGILLAGSGVLALGALGLPTDNAAPLGPLMSVLVVTGHLLPARLGFWSVPVLLAATAIGQGWDLVSIIFGFFLLLLPWWFGSLVRGRDIRRRQAAEDAVRLSLRNPATMAEEAAAAAREQVSARALADIAGTVAEMTRAASQARESLDPTAIDQAHHSGVEATERLRGLLVVLRTTPDSPEDPDAAARAESGADRSTGIPGTGHETPPSRAGWMDLLLGSWPVVLILADIVLVPWLVTMSDVPEPPPAAPPAFLLLVALPIMVAVVVRHRHPVASLVGSTAVIGAGVLTGPADLDRDGLRLAIALAALSWAAGRAGTRAATLAWILLTTTVLTLVALHTPDNLPIQIAMHVLPFGAAAAWSGHHTAGNAHLDRARVRRHEIEAAERAAVAAERLRLARDLHDAASHAIGAMMMQVNAARVLRERDPDGARAALDAVVTIGTEAGTELLRVPAATALSIIPPPDGGSRSDAGAALLAAVRPLIRAAELAGADVTTSVDLSSTPELAAGDLQLLYRVAREGVANAVRHSPGSDITIDVTTTPTLATARVTNGPPRTDPVSTTGSGLGLAGLRELLEGRAGELTAGPTVDGYQLTATFAPAHVPHPEVVP